MTYLWDWVHVTSDSDLTCTPGSVQVIQQSAHCLRSGIFRLVCSPARTLGDHHIGEIFAFTHLTGRHIMCSVVVYTACISVAGIQQSVTSLSGLPVIEWMQGGPLFILSSHMRQDWLSNRLSSSWMCCPFHGQRRSTLLHVESRADALPTAAATPAPPAAAVPPPMPSSSSSLYSQHFSSLSLWSLPLLPFGTQAAKKSSPGVALLGQSFKLPLVDYHL